MLGVGNRLCLDPFGLYIFTTVSKDYCLRYVYANLSAFIRTFQYRYCLTIIFQLLYLSPVLDLCCIFFVQPIGLMRYSQRDKTLF